jgi:hypothetical protein
MRKGWGIGLLLGCMVIGPWGCATSPLPPSESTMSIVRSYQEQLSARVSSGHLTPAQARELFYAKLAEIQPPLPGLDELLKFRNETMSQVEAKTLTPEQAASRLAARDSEMLTRWDEMAAKYAQDQRNIQRMQNDYERGYRQQQQMEQTIKTLPR